MINRPRRLRQSENIRSLIRETKLSVDDLVAPLFVYQGKTPIEISTMPGQYRWPLEHLLGHIEKLVNLGIKAIALFAVVEDKLKDHNGSYGVDENNFYLNSIRQIKARFPSLLIMSDVALDPYSSTGHDGIVCPEGKILNDPTIELLAKMALLQAQAGSDIVGPSDMMDGRIKAIRGLLDAHQCQDTLIMAYTAKYASSFYGPFRDALDSAPRSGDKKSYQMDPSNRREMFRELALDLKEGADIVMVKPGLAYLDIIREMADRSDRPVAAFNVSGEYAMIKFAAQAKALNEQQAMLEMLLGFKRAGTDLILTYFAEDAARFFSV